MKTKTEQQMHDAANRFLDEVLAGKRDIPHNALLLNLPQDRIAQLMTPKRLALVQLIRKKKPRSLKELARLAGRKLQAVIRDLRLYQRYDVVELRREGRAIRPIAEKTLVIVPLGLPAPRKSRNAAGRPVAHGNAPASMAVSAQSAK